MTDSKQKIQNAFFFVLLGLAVATIAYQASVNHGHYEDGKREVKNAYRHDDFPHPMLIWRTPFHTLYVQAIYNIQNSPHSKFWLVSQDLDAMMMMNYFVYPKELRVNKDVQIIYEEKHYKEDYLPFTQDPPLGEYQETIYTHFKGNVFD